MAVSKVAVLGAGSWGTALAHHLSLHGRSTVLWGLNAEVVDEINSHHTNSKYFPDDKLHPAIRAAVRLDDALEGAGLIVIAVPSFAVREVAKLIGSRRSLPVVSAAKGLEDGSLSVLTDVLKEELGGDELVGALSGPSFALEVLRGRPTAVTVAARTEGTARVIAEAFHAGSFRVYTSADVVGVQLGGAIKNVIALAVGILDGVEMGLNARAALITRGLAEMQRLVVKMGGQNLTVAGLSGLGDLLLTCTGDLSRNRRVGLRLGRGEKLGDILADLGQVAEGVETAHKIVALAKRHGVELPICEEVERLLAGQSSAEVSAKALLSRAQKPEV